jgi:DNA topoisomerase-2
MAKLADRSNIHPASPCMKDDTLDYDKKTQLEHILLRPDTYIGSVEQTTEQMWVWDSLQEKMVYRNITYNPGLYKIFDEIIVNAADNKQRDDSMDTIKVEIDAVAGTISVLNNGMGIPVEKHTKHGVYVPELVFGELLTSSNFNDDKKKVTGGRNGFGAKLTNIYSEEFIVETADTKRNRRYKQVFSNNMSEKGTPVIKEGTKDSWTKITFKPDLSRFHGMTMLDNDTVSLMKRRVFDIAGSTHKSVKVYLDGTKLPIKCFKDYVEMFRTDKEKPLVCEKVNDTWEVCCTISESSFQQVSFVNSIATTKGGKHVDHVVDQIVEKLVAAIKKKHKSVPIKPAHVKNQLSIFINCLIVNPAFNSQTKEFMNSQVKKFGSVCNLSDKFFKEVINSGIVDNILNWAQLKASAELKKTGGKKKGRISGITKLDDANEAGGRNASQCALILTEGDSAKALAVSGLSVVGRDHYGVFPLKGKLLNVRDANHQQLMNNEEIKNILQIMGLQHGKEYEDTRSLRYGHIMIMADQDHDGSHIKVSHTLCAKMHISPLRGMGVGVPHHLTRKLKGHECDGYATT